MTRTFASNQCGAILLEAAIALPVLIMILLGMVEFGDAFTASRKNAQVAQTAADLVSQQTNMTTVQANNIANVRTTIFQPYSATPSGLRVSSIIQNANNATVQWSRSWGTLSALGNNSTFTLPSGLINQGDTIIVAEASYAFTPTIGVYLTGVVTFDSVAYYVPRGPSVTCCS